MRQRLLGFFAAAFAVAAFAWALQHFAFGREREWTTRSREALAAYDAGLEASMRLYRSDAAVSFRRALELDPEFAAAKVQLAAVTAKPEERKSLLEALGATDLSRLTERERFLVEVALASDDRAKQNVLVSRELEVRPDDPWVLSFAAGQAWDAEEWDRASALYRRLIEIDPNWIKAHNSLGYLAMSRERFAEAEEHFRTYAYIAPDQANPHDSLGELLSLLGRYDEARTELELAIAEKPDFCSSYVTLIGVALFEGDPGPIPQLVERSRKSCPPRMVEELECESRLIAAFLERDADRPWREGFISCAGEPGKRGVLVHRLAMLAGRQEEADAQEQAIAEALVEIEREAAKGYESGKLRTREMELRHMLGVRRLFEGHAAEAATEFRSADEGSAFWGASEGRFKLFNRVHLALALERLNDPAGAARVLDSVRKVNSAFAELYPAIVSDLPAPPAKPPTRRAAP